MRHSVRSPGRGNSRRSDFWYDKGYGARRGAVGVYGQVEKIEKCENKPIKSRRIKAFCFERVRSRAFGRWPRRDAGDRSQASASIRRDTHSERENRAGKCENKPTLCWNLLRFSGSPVVTVLASKPSRRARCLPSLSPAREGRQESNTNPPW